jgi:hypothetical protein
MAKKRRKVVKAISFEPRILSAVDEYCKRFKIDRSAFVNEAAENLLLLKTEGQYKEYLIPIIESVLTDVIRSEEVQISISKKLREFLSRRN